MELANLAHLFPANAASLLMTQPLVLRPSPACRETFPSFLSRIAAMNGVSAMDFYLDMGFSLKHTIELEGHTVCKTGQLGGLAPDAPHTMLSWTGKRMGNVRMASRDDVFVSRAPRNPIVRGVSGLLAGGRLGSQGSSTRGYGIAR